MPPRVNAPAFKVDASIYTMLKAEGLFRNSIDDDPHQHVKNFIGMCAMHKQPNVPDDIIRLGVFKYPLTKEAQTWLHSLPLNSITTWEELVNVLLKKWFPPRKLSWETKSFTWNRYLGNNSMKSGSGSNNIVKGCKKSWVSREHSSEKALYGCWCFEPICSQ